MENIKKKVLHEIELVPARVDKEKAIVNIENDMQTLANYDLLSTGEIEELLNVLTAYR